MNKKRLTFQNSRRDLYDIIRITAAQRPLRKVALPGLAGFVFLGHAIDGNYGKGVIWAVIVGSLYWGISHMMYLLHVYGAGNSTLMVPQTIELLDDEMVVSSEHGNERFLRPDPADVKSADRHLVVTTSTGKLVFLERSFEMPGDYRILRDWLMAGRVAVS